MIAERLTAQLLAGNRPAEVTAVVERLLAVQAQDPRGARLAIRARSVGLSADDVDRALTVDRSLVVTWLNRGTLHLVRAEDYPWLQALTTPPLWTGNARRLAQEGVSPDQAERGVRVIERALTREGPLARRQLGERLAAAGVPTAGQAVVHVLGAASLRGVCLRGPMVGGEQAFVLARDWLEAPRTAMVSRDRDRDAMLAELARRYLVGHGPAEDRDLAKWAGLPLRDARSGLRAIGAEVRERPDGLLDLRRRPAAEPLPPPRLLGAYDPVLHGWTSREPLLEGAQSVITVNGLFRPFALVQGKAVATWALRDGEVSLEPLKPISARDRAALRRDAADVVRFLAPGRPGSRRPSARRVRAG